MANGKKLLRNGSEMNLLDCEAANDAAHPYTYEDLVELSGVDPLVCVPESTYKPGYRCFSQFIRIEGAYKLNYKEGDYPVIMRGAWHRMIEVNKPYNHFAMRVMDRWIRRLKLTILSDHNSDKVKKRFYELIDAKPAKRSSYRNITNGHGTACTFSKRSYGYTFYMEGKKYYAANKAQFQIMRSIHRQIKKLDENFGDEKWQELTQRVN